MQEVTTEMREKGINSMEWIEREEWKGGKRINTIGTEKCENIEILYFNKMYYYYYYYYYYY